MDGEELYRIYATTVSLGFNPSWDDLDEREKEDWEAFASEATEKFKENLE